jgi:hypothetical protein
MGINLRTHWRSAGMILTTGTGIFTFSADFRAKK